MGWCKSLRGWISNQPGMKRKRHANPRVFCFNAPKVPNFSLVSAKTFERLIALAQRGIPQFGVHLWQMETTPMPQSQMTVENVLQNWPSTYSVFMDMKTKCIGCFLQRFCTLQDVADTYQIPIQKLTGEMEKYISTLNHLKRSTL